MRKDREFYDRVKTAVDNRLSGRRLEHVHSVSEYAAELAEMYGVNTFDAKIAGLLHDWDKLLVDDELPARMAELGIELPEHVELLMPVLHSFTGAKAVEREFPELEPQIISAIWNHTLGAVEMGDLDMVIFVADMIEPTRSAEKRPHLTELREAAGKIPLEDLYFLAYRETMFSLIERRRYIHPAAFDIWNSLVQRHHPEQGKRGQGNPDVVL